MTAADHHAILRILADHADTDAPINSAATFEALGIDSLGVLEVAQAIEVDLKLQLNTATWTPSMTVGQLFDIVDRARLS